MVEMLTSGILALVRTQYPSSDQDDEEHFHASELDFYIDGLNVMVRYEQLDMTLQSLPKEIWRMEIISYLDKKAIKTFLASMRPKHISSMQLDRVFCLQHGCRLEETFSSQTLSVEMTRNENVEKYCPDCFMQSNQLVRCQQCLTYYQASSLLPQEHVWCHSCKSMAFCNDCMSRKHCIPTTFIDINKCTVCCHSLFTNTTCGQFLCMSCASTTSQATERKAYDCHMCGKTTCCDENCLVCDHIQLVRDGLDYNETQNLCNLAFWLSLWILILAVVWCWND
jgi:hypothetical protein